VLNDIELHEYKYYVIRYTLRGCPNDNLNCINEIFKCWKVMLFG